MRKTTSIELELFKNNDNGVKFYAKQFDDLKLKVKVFDGTEQVDVSKQDITVFILKEDKTVIEQKKDIEVDEDNVILIDLSKQSTTALGKCLMELSLSDEEGNASTSTVSYMVGEKLSASIVEMIKSEDDINALNLIEEFIEASNIDILEIKEAIKDIKDNALNVENKLDEKYNEIIKALEDKQEELNEKIEIGTGKIEEIKVENERAENNINDLEALCQEAEELKENTINEINETKESAINTITNTKDEAVVVINNAKDGAVGEVNNTKNTAIGETYATRDVVVGEVYAVRDVVVREISGVKDTAIGDIYAKKDEVISLANEEITAKKDEIVALANGEMTTKKDEMVALASGEMTTKKDEAVGAINGTKDTAIGDIYAKKDEIISLANEEISNKKDEIVALANEEMTTKKNEIISLASGEMTAKKDEMVALATGEMTIKKDEAVGAINGTKDTVIGEVYTTKDSVIGEIHAKKDEVVALASGEIDAKKDEAINEINTVKDNAIGEVNNTKDNILEEIKGTKEGLLSTIEEGKNVKDELNNKVQTGTDLLSNINTTLQNAEEANTALDESTQEGTETKEGLLNEILNANNTKGVLDNAVANANYIKDKILEAIESGNNTLPRLEEQLNSITRIEEQLRLLIGEADANINELNVLHPETDTKIAELRDLIEQAIDIAIPALKKYIEEFTPAEDLTEVNERLEALTNAINETYSILTNHHHDTLYGASKKQGFFGDNIYLFEKNSIMASHQAPEWITDYKSCIQFSTFKSSNTEFYSIYFKDDLNDDNCEVYVSLENDVLTIHNGVLSQNYHAMRGTGNGGGGQTKETSFTLLATSKLYTLDFPLWDTNKESIVIQSPKTSGLTNFDDANIAGYYTIDLPLSTFQQISNAPSLIANKDIKAVLEVKQVGASVMQTLTIHSLGQVFTRLIGQPWERIDGGITGENVMTIGASDGETLPEGIATMPKNPYFWDNNTG